MIGDRQRETVAAQRLEAVERRRDAAVGQLAQVRLEIAAVQPETVEEADQHLRAHAVVEVFDLVADHAWIQRAAPEPQALALGEPKASDREMMTADRRRRQADRQDR